VKALETIKSIFESCASDMSSLPPTALYNEGWMLRLLLEWFSKQPASGHPLDFTEGSRWYSEALIPSAFKPRNRGDRLAESWTHVDGVIGHFRIGKNRNTDLTVPPNANTLKVLEAKMFSRLSAGTTHARYYNQAARNIACVAEILKKAADENNMRVEMSTLAFYLIAPSSQIQRGIFEDNLSKESLSSVVKRRVDEYDEDRSEWYQEWFLPTLEKIEIKSISWEDILLHVNNVDSDIGNDLKLFYDSCLKYNRFNKLSTVSEIEN